MSALRQLSPVTSCSINTWTKMKAGWLVKLILIKIHLPKAVRDNFIFWHSSLENNKFLKTEWSRMVQYSMKVIIRRGQSFAFHAADLHIKALRAFMQRNLIKFYYCVLCGLKNPLLNMQYTCTNLTTTTTATTYHTKVHYASTQLPPLLTIRIKYVVECFWVVQFPS